MVTRTVTVSIQNDGNITHTFNVKGSVAQAFSGTGCAISASGVLLALPVQQTTLNVGQTGSLSWQFDDDLFVDPGQQKTLYIVGEIWKEPEGIICLDKNAVSFLVEELAVISAKVVGITVT